MKGFLAILMQHTVYEDKYSIFIRYVVLAYNLLIIRLFVVESCCILQKMSGVKVLIVSKVAADNAYEKKKH